MFNFERARLTGKFRKNLLLSWHLDHSGRVSFKIHSRVSAFSVALINLWKKRLYIRDENEMNHEFVARRAFIPIVLHPFFYGTNDANVSIYLYILSLFCLFVTRWSYMYINIFPCHVSYLRGRFFFVLVSWDLNVTCIIQLESKSCFSFSSFCANVYSRICNAKWLINHLTF